MNRVAGPSLSLMIAAALLSCAAAAQSQSYPARPVRLIVATSPGAAVDIAARLIAPKLSESLGQQVVVENRAGAGQIIGSEFVARSPPDGYTLLMVTTPFVVSPAMYKKVPYDALRDFAPITQIVSLPNILIAHPSLPAKNVKELIALAKSHPGQLSFASAGVGTYMQLSMELFIDMTKVKMLHVPYKGAGQAMIDVVAGQVPLSFPTVLTALGYVRDGRLRGLGVSSVKRMSSAPDIPTIAEAGVPGYEATNWLGISAPADTPREIVNRLNADIARVLQQPDIQKRFALDGADTVGGPPEAFAALLRTETAKWARIVKIAGIEPE